MVKTQTAHQYSLCKHTWDRHSWKAGLWQCQQCGQVEVVKPASKRKRGTKTSSPTLPLGTAQEQEA